MYINITYIRSITLCNYMYTYMYSVMLPKIIISTCRVCTLIFLTSSAVAPATCLANWTNSFLATGLLVRLEANLHALQSVPVCLAITVAACKT